MMTQKYVIICILLYFIGVYLFFTTQFVSHKQIHGYSTNSLLMIDGDNGGQMMGDKQSNLNQNKINKNITNLQVSQVVLIIIDALRYDYLQRIPFFKQTLQKYPKTTLIKKSIVGNPTMTTQRIESLMTGSQIFTSTNILDMFLSQKITTDNIADQLIRHNKTVKVFGDDTWVKLFNIFSQNSFVCDSTFNIRDYDSCDQLIYQNLPKFIKKAQNKKTKQIKQNQQKDKTNQINYDKLLIAHFLSLDHIGHSTSSISSHFMEQKMQKISLYLEYLIQLSADDTMFIITGDHGMRQDGNHGGNTHAETQSLFFSYYKNKVNQQQNFEQRIENFESTVVNQVDLTPTLSLLLGVNNPINSIGYPVIEILPSRYQKYLSTISYNILTGYERIINNQNNQQQSTTTESIHTQQCITKINTIKQSISTKQSEQLKQFKHHIQLKQYIKRQIQQSQCLSGSLSMTLPNNILVMLSLIIIGASFLLLVGGIVYSELKLIILNNNTVRLLSQLFSIILQHIAWISSLFVIYFSWYLIRNSSTYMLLIIVIYIALIPSSIMTMGRKLIIILLLLLLTQYQPYKINQYQLNYFNLQIIQSLTNIFTTISNQSKSSNNDKSQVIQIKLTLHIICIAIWTIIQIKSYLKVLFKSNKSIKSKRTNRNDIKYNKNQSNITSSFKITTYLTIFLLIINIIQIIINQKLINNNHNNNNNNMITSNIKFYLRYVIFITISILLYCFQYYNFKHQNIDQQKQQYKHAILMVGFGQIVGYQHFISLLIYLIIIQLIFTTKQHQKLLTIKAKNNKATTSNNNKTYNQNKNNKSSYQQNKGLKIILISLLAEYMWWILGNRYQYSSIDIKKSYLLTDQFNIYLNTIAMLLWFMAPYISSIYFTFLYLSLYKQSQSTTTLQLQQQESQQFNNNNNNMNQQHSSLSLSSSYKQTSLNNSTTTYYLNITKLLLIPLSGLFSSSINLYLNNMKILFTIVYVPLFILGMVKTIIITSIIIIGFIIIMVMKK